MVIHRTKGIVLKTVKYGETSVIVSVFTELFGVQSYLVNGIRTTGKTSSKAALFQPSAILDLEVYHNELKNLQRIKEYKWAFLYQHVLTDVTKNAVAMYMVELLQKSLKQPENNPDLFHFCEESFIQLDGAETAEIANFPIYFCLHLAYFFGFRLQDNYSQSQNILDMKDGLFIDHIPSHSYFMEPSLSKAVAEILKTRHPSELTHTKLNQKVRRDILLALQTYYALHIQDFGILKTLPVVHTILGEA
jgi:DNA repair protein RecO (recombination protein O)